MNKVQKLTAEDLYKRCDFGEFNFKSTDDLDHDNYTFLGQERARTSADFGIRMKQDGYNIFALGPEEVDKKSLLESLVNREAGELDVPGDWVYVCNFEDEQKPIALNLKPGDAIRFRDKMNRFAEDLPNVLTSVFESEEYQNRRQVIEERVKEKEQEEFAEIQKKAEEKGLSIIRTPMGYSVSPIKDGDVMDMEDIKKMSDKEREKLEQEVQELQKELQKILRQIPEQQRKIKEEKDELNREFTEYAVKGLLEEVKRDFEYDSGVSTYLKNAKKDIIDRAEIILNPGGGNPFFQAASDKPDSKKSPDDHPVLWRYTVNLMVNNSGRDGAPVIYEDHPIYNNLIGRIEHVSEMGALTTDFTYLRPGSLLKANGGFIIIDALRLLTQPFAWDGLKRALLSRQLKIEAPGEMYGLLRTVSLEPAPIDLNVKVILIGSRLLYYLLCAYDKDFQNLFKVEVDFDDETDRNPESQKMYAYMIASLLHKNKLLPMEKSAVVRVIEHTSRMVSDNEKLTTKTKDLLKLLQEADYWSRQKDAEVTDIDAVRKAIDQSRYRSGRIRDKYQDQIIRKSIFIDTEGSKTGQVNGLSVISLGNSIFSHPTRITARVRVGKGEVINIEREVEMSGPIHSKGVLILSAFLGARYAMEKPLSLSASLVFEQSYGGVEGDSASSTELYALLSAIGDIPIKQSIAVSGSVNQHGEIQPIGGVNEKIEGFFEICEKRGLTGEQGVMIPEANVKNLMLKDEVIQAVNEGKFHIYAIQSVDQGMELLTGLEMGERDEKGNYPKGSVNSMVEDKLGSFADIQQHYIGRTNQTSVEMKGK
ncbi:MAG: ATP-dependent protease [Balneolaceae bacterium]|nr:MAG: ATP-dependent protease [Balneolaceae bacterium]